MTVNKSCPLISRTPLLRGFRGLNFSSQNPRNRGVWLYIIYTVHALRGSCALQTFASPCTTGTRAALPTSRPVARARGGTAGCQRAASCTHPRARPGQAHTLLRARDREDTCYERTIRLKYFVFYINKLHLNTHEFFDDAYVPNELEHCINDALHFDF
jgi:hypothetical protein